LGLKIREILCWYRW